MSNSIRNNNNIAGVFGQQVSRHTASSLSRCCRLLWYREWRNDWHQEYEQGPITKTRWGELSAEQKKKIARFDNVNSCIRKSVWSEVPFPEAPYAEDVGWAIDVLTSGYAIFWQPNAQVSHSHDRSLAYEFKRSYVNMKTINEIFEGDAPGMPIEKARHVIDWVVEEARRFLEAREGRGVKKSIKDCEILNLADAVWQSCNRAQHTTGSPGKNHYNSVSRCSEK